MTTTFKAGPWEFPKDDVVETLGERFWEDMPGLLASPGRNLAAWVFSSGGAIACAVWSPDDHSIQGIPGPDGLTPTEAMAWCDTWIDKLSGETGFDLTNPIELEIVKRRLAAVKMPTRGHRVEVRPVAYELFKKEQVLDGQYTRARTLLLFPPFHPVDEKHPDGFPRVTVGQLVHLVLSPEATVALPRRIVSVSYGRLHDAADPVLLGEPVAEFAVAWDQVNPGFPWGTNPWVQILTLQAPLDNIVTYKTVMAFNEAFVAQGLPPIKQEPSS